MSTDEYVGHRTATDGGLWNNQAAGTDQGQLIQNLVQYLFSFQGKNGMD